MACYAICIIPCVPCLPYNYSFQHAFLHICDGENEIFSIIYIYRFLVVRWSMEEYFKAHPRNYKKLFEILRWEALVRMKKLLEWAMYASLSLQSDKNVIARKTLKCLIKLMDRLHGIGMGYDEGMESRTVMVLANGMVYKSREELKDDSALLFGLIFLAYLDIGCEYFCLLHRLFAFMYTSYFCLVLVVMP